MRLPTGYRGFHRIWWSPHYFYVLSSIWSKIFALVWLIEYQLFDLLLSLELKSHILETNSHFAPELLICVLGDLIMRNLAYTARLLDASIQPLWSVRKFLLLVYFSSWVESLLVFGCCPSLYVTLWIFHVSHASQGSAKPNLFLFVGFSHGFRDHWSNPFLPFTKVFLNGGLQWNLWLMA